jgi:hypothetical protein
VDPPPSRLLLPILCFLFVRVAGLAAGAAGDDSPQRVASFRKAYFGNDKVHPGREEKRAALELLKGLDAPMVANALLDACASCEEERAAKVDEQNQAKDELAKISADEALGARQFPLPVATRMKALKDRIAELEAEVAAIAGLERDVAAPLLAQKSDESFHWLLANALGAKKLPLKLKTSIARLSAGRGEGTAEAVALMTKQLAKAKDGEEVFVLIDGLSACGPAARPAAATVAARLSEKEPTLREHAAAALVALAAADGIEPLIRALEAETDAHTRRRIAVALETLTRQQFGETAPAWRSWWKGEGEKTFAAGAPAGGGVSALAKALTVSGGRNYYGIPVDGKSIVYVIDCSGSMVASVNAPHYDEKRNSVDAGKGSRMEATKAALIAVLGKLGPKDKFDVVSFNDLVHPYASGLVAATPLEVSNAQDWVHQLSPMYSTNIYDAMQHAIRLAGRGSFDKYYVAGVDTIFLLTDGAPTTPDGRLDSTDRVLEGVRQWNSTGRIVIHTIGIGKDINDVFLKKMAAENHGTFVQQ